MLKHLLIKNYALIQQLEITPSENLNIITGETGAGKSIMLGAVGLLLGNRADTKVLLSEDSKCIIEGQFKIGPYNMEALFEQEDLDYAGLSILRREISPSGKSRAFINDTPVTLDVLKKFGTRLMDVHSQHETLNLGKHNYQLAFVDAYAGIIPLRNSYKTDYLAYRSHLKVLNELKKENEEISKEADFNNFLLDELVNADLKAGEQEELETSLKVMEHAEEIKTKLNESISVLSASEYAAVNGVQEARLIFGQLSKYSGSYKAIEGRLESTLIELQDIIAEIEKEEEGVAFDPEQTQLAQERISMIFQLQQKHHVSTTDDLLHIQQDLEARAERFNNLDDEINNAAQLVDKLKEKATAGAEILSKKRRAVFIDLAGELKELLGEVGIPDATITITCEKTELTDRGMDQINILFSANKGIAPQEISKAASGGEFSRLMFCVKYILADKISLPSIIFDEIDTGVSGEIALKLGAMMQRMAQKHQVITISHLPQIAAKGNKHYFVFKDNSSVKAMSRIKSLDEDERISEIAKMIGGDTPSVTAFESAKELIGSRK